MDFAVRGPASRQIFTIFVAVGLSAVAARSQGGAAGSFEERLRQIEQRHRSELEAIRTEHEARLRALEGSAGMQNPTGGGNAQNPGGVMPGPFGGLPNPGGNMQLAQGDQRRGIGRLGQTTVFDNLFNPAISLSADFALPMSDRANSSEDLNQFSLRSMELGIVGRVDPYMSYQTYIHFDEEEVEIEEAYGLVDNALPDTFMLKFGRFNLDFGKLSPIHDHDLPFLDKPQVLQEYLGGSLRGTGAEVHHWVPFGEVSLVRWMVGVTNQLDGDSHASFGPAAGEHGHGEEGEEIEPFGRRNFDNFAFHARASALVELDLESSLQVGVSGAWAPEVDTFFEPMPGTVAKSELQQHILGVDITYRTQDPASARGLTIAGEALYLDRQALDDTDTETTTRAFGYYAYAERRFNLNWAAGVSGGMYEHAEDSSEESWDVGAYGSWFINEFNRLRLEARHFDDPDEESFGITLQWTTILGSHGHGIDW